MIESKISIKLERFPVPDSAYELPPMPTASPCTRDWNRPCLPSRQFQLSELSSEVLLEMCEVFKREVFKRAGKSSYLQMKAIVE